MTWQCSALLALGLWACGGVIDGSTSEEAVDAGISPDDHDARPISPLRDDGQPVGPRRALVEQLLDHETLSAGYALAGYTPPPGAIIYAARIGAGAGEPSMVLFDYGAGAFSSDFWPASTIKLLSALGALDFARAQGFTGAAQIHFSGIGNLGSLRDLYSASIGVSDNLAYTRTLQIAGVERINQSVLTTEHGFADTVLTRSYVSGTPANQTPAFTFTEGAANLTIPARTDPTDFGCVGNCTNLYELGEGLRRVVLDTELVASQRFDLDAADIGGLNAALCDAESFFAAGAERALGPVRVCNKPGWVPDFHYLDHGIITVDSSGERYLLAAAIPWPQACSSHTGCTAMLSTIAEYTLPIVRDAVGVPIQDEGTGITVQRDSPTDLQIDAPGADSIRVWLDRSMVIEAEDQDGRFAITLPEAPAAGTVITVQGFADNDPIAHRALHLGE